MKTSIFIRWLSAILFLPINVTIIIPLILFDLNISESNNLEKWLAIFIGLPGLILSVISARLFAKKGGGGTPAPWDPINNLIISGPYRYVRNPMLIGVNIVLFSESLLFKSFPLFIYSCLFFFGNIIYFRTSEEPTLIRRYGSEYRDYLENVPRWMPRIKPYYPKK